eukprot:CAMPEP_0116579224 /NCGR_PEP_ID=MMETSP0397-20121206/22140_1 /TAXON_ID=216820 /ORGANISM="Cyclophora tenuis, Strain ECT3854" /LENGTH=295 /DNA_ID=CAMNT_0004108695 /DNA_START=1 /DNA_END=888 /DNA_ORIENTATION=+
MSSALFPDPEQPKTRGHHRSTSSSVSFLTGLEDASEVFNLGTPSSSGPPKPAVPANTTSAGPSVKPATPAATQPATHPALTPSQSTGLAAGGTSKRIRRKCTVEGCPNRVVQGGLCISHGAKRKTCKHPGCTKNVKKAGLCSTHGPARKRCEAEGCTKVAVQGGRCIAHGAKKKLCSVDACSKQAILGGMCKKHHDLTNGIVNARGGKRVAADVGQPPSCVVIDGKKKDEKSGHKGGHTRGLSIFQEISPDAVGNLLSSEGAGAGAAGARGSSQGHPLRDGERSGSERGSYGTYY